MSLGLESKTIIRLLLDFAPKRALKELELDENTREEWVDCLESERNTARGQYETIDMSSLALYYATRKRSSIKRLATEGRIKVDFWTLFEFAETIKAEEFDSAENLLRKVSLQKKQKLIAEARDMRGPKYDWTEVSRLTTELLAAGKSPRDLSGIIETRLGIPRSTFRDWRRKKKTTG